MILVLLVLATIAIVAVLITTITRAVRLRRARRRTLLTAGPRKQLVALLVGGGDTGLDQLATLSPAQWNALEPTAVAMLEKVSGDARDTLALLFERHGVITHALTNLRRSGFYRRANAAETLGTLYCRRALPDLDLLLDSSSPEMRMVALRALGRIGEPASAESMLASVARHPMTPTSLVAYTLYQIGQQSSPALLHAMDHSSPRVRLAAIEAVQLLGAPSSQNVCTRVAHALRTDESTAVRQHAAEALGRLGTQAALTALLDATSPTQPPVVRAAAVSALGILGARVAVDPLRDLLGDEEHSVAHAAARALLRLGPDGLTALRDQAQGGDLAAAHAAEAFALTTLGERPRGGPTATPPAGRVSPLPVSG